MTRDWRGRRVFFVSDQHKGAGGPADDFAKHAALYSEFLRRLLQTSGCLAHLGDGEELWQFGSTEIAKEYGAIGRLYGRLIEDDRFHATEGNHDEEATALPILAGLKWASPAVTIETDCGRIWGEHGNRWDPWNRTPGWAHRFLLMALKGIEKVAPDADVLDEYRRPPDRKGPSRDAKLTAGARAVLVGSSLSGVVMGHSHRGGSWKIETPAGPRAYVNCGAWTESCIPGVAIADANGLRYLEVDPGNPRWDILFG